MYMSHPSGYYERFKKQLTQAGIEFDVDFDEEFSWKRMVEWQGAKGDEYPDRLLIFVGGWDTLLMGTKLGIQELNWDVMITFAGDKLCWPDDRIGDYMKKGWAGMGHPLGPWRYMNTGPMMGPGWLIREAVGWGMSNCPLLADDKDIVDSESGTDMKFWTSVHLDSPFGTQIDYKCRLGQTTLHEVDGDFSLTSNGRV